jgi:T-complex protein 1 subunit zeta
VQEEHKQGNVVGLDVSTGEALDPAVAGIFDNYLVKKQILQSAPIVASQLLLVDEVMRAGEGTGASCTACSNASFCGASTHMTSA